jgi:hypothetical protein
MLTSEMSLPPFNMPIASSAAEQAEFDVITAKWEEFRREGGPDAKDIRQTIKTLSKLSHVPECKAAHDWLKKIQIEPPPKVDVKKWWCACEAFELMEQFSRQKPSDTGHSGQEKGAFHTIAALLYEAVFGEPEADMQRACAAVLRVRRAQGRGVPRDRVTGAVVTRPRRK